MKIYLLIEVETGNLVDVFKYQDIALMRAKNKGIVGSFKSLINGNSIGKYRVEVRELIE